LQAINSHHDHSRIIIITPKSHQNNVSRSDKKILQKEWNPKKYAKIMSKPNPIVPIQICMWDSSIDDNELKEVNIGHHDDADNNVDE